MSIDRVRQLIVAFCATYFSARVAARVVVIRFGDGDELKKIAKKNLPFRKRAYSHDSVRAP